jgi:hypothetical protein
VKCFSGSVERNDDNHAQSRDRNIIHTQQAQQSTLPHDDNDILVPFPDKSDPVHDALKNKPNLSQVRSQSKQRIPRPYAGKCWDKALLLYIICF